MTTDKSITPLPAPIDVTDPWRGLYQATRLPAPTEYGDIAHPDIPCWPDDREDALDKLVHAQGFDFQIVAGEFTEAALEEGDELYWAEMRAWTPVAPPEGEWRLAWKGDTEDGPYAWFVRPMALRPEPVALAATGKQQVGEVQGDAFALARELRAAMYEADGRLGMADLVRKGHVKDVECGINVLAATLAARQPGAQEAVDDDWHLRGYAYASKQATTCAGCGKHKHTPLRIDAMGGYVCLTCIDQKIGALLGEFGYPPAQGIDLHRLVPPQWLSEQLGGVIDDLTPGQAWRQGFNQCRARALLLVEQAMGFPSEQQRDAAPGVGNG